jgi:hypothetical protein
MPPPMTAQSCCWTMGVGARYELMPSAREHLPDCQSREGINCCSFAGNESLQT